MQELCLENISISDIIGELKKTNKFVDESTSHTFKSKALERINKLLTPNTFIEINKLAKHRCTEFGMENQDLPSDGVITGYGKINGRSVCIFSQDFSVMGGSIGEMHANKICHIIDLAMKTGSPLIGLYDSGGARIQESIDALSGCGKIFFKNSMASGIIPQISAIMGPCAGAAAYSPALTDFIFMVKDTSYMFITGPQIVKAYTGEDISNEMLGGVELHNRISGVSDYIAENEDDCLIRIKELLSFFPRNDIENEKYMDIDNLDQCDINLSKIIPENPKIGYDMHDIITRVVDDGHFFEIKRDFSQNIITCFARLAGKNIGIIANQPKVLAGSLDVDASDKATRFIRFCDSFNIPILNFVDVSGFLPGIQQEQRGIIRHGAKMLYAYSEATVPKITVILRKGYGGAYLAMCSKDLGADFVFALPTAEIAVMGAEGAVNIIFKKETEEIKKEKINEYKMKFANPYYAASKNHITAIIEPHQIRSEVISALQLLRNKKEDRPVRKHGNIPV